MFDTYCECKPLSDMVYNLIKQVWLISNLELVNKLYFEKWKVLKDIVFKFGLNRMLKNYIENVKLCIMWKER